MIARRFPRNTAPHIPTLADSNRALLGPQPYIHFVESEAGNYVEIVRSDWSGVDLAAVQAAVTAAPEASDKLDAKAYLKSLTVYERASMALLLKQINTIRGKLVPALQPITLAQYITALENEIDALS